MKSQSRARCPARRPDRARRCVTTACSLVGGSRRQRATTSKRVVLVTHESFVLPKELQQQFEDESPATTWWCGPSGDAGALTNKLVLTKDDPTGDVGVRRRQHLRLPGPRRGRVRAVRRRRCRAGADALRAARRRRPPRSRRSTTATSASTSTTPGSPTTTCPAADARRPDRPGVQGPLRRCPAPPPARPAWRSCWPRSRRTARTAGRATGSELMANGAKLTDGLVGRLRGRLHPGRRQGRPADRAVLRLLARVHRAARARHLHHQRAARHLLPPGRVRRRARGRAERRGRRRRSSTSCSAPRCRRRCPTSMYVFPVVAGAALPPDWAQFAEQPDRPVHRRPGRRSPRTATSGCSEWSDVTAGDAPR